MTVVVQATSVAGPGPPSLPWSGRTFPRPAPALVWVDRAGVHRVGAGGSGSLTLLPGAGAASIALAGNTLVWADRDTINTKVSQIDLKVPFFSVWPSNRTLYNSIHEEF